MNEALLSFHFSESKYEVTYYFGCTGSFVSYLDLETHFAIASPVGPAIASSRRDGNLHVGESFAGWPNI